MATLKCLHQSPKLDCICNPRLFILNGLIPTMYLHPNQQEFLKAVFRGLQPLPSDKEQQADEVRQHSATLILATIGALSSQRELACQALNDIICTLTDALCLLPAAYLSQVRCYPTALAHNLTMQCLITGSGEHYGARIKTGREERASIWASV